MIFKVLEWIFGGGCVVTFLSTIFPLLPEYNLLKKWIDKKIELSQGLILFMILCVVSIIFKIINSYDTKLEKEKEKNRMLQNKCEEYKEKLSKNFEAAMNNMDKHDQAVVNLRLKDFVEGSDYVIAAQIYKCNKKIKDNQMIYSIWECEYKYVRNGESVNDVSESYSFDMDKLNKYRALKEKYVSDQNKYQTEFAKYIADLTKSINSKKDEEVTDSVIFDYCCLCLSIQHMFGQDHIEIKNIEKEYQQKIRNKKRDGFLNGIIEQDYFKFRNQKNPNKDRFYIIKCIEIQERNEPYIFVIVIDKGVIHVGNYTEYLDGIGEKFYDVLTNKVF